MMRPCKQCGNSGVIYDRTVEAGTYGELKVCSHVEKACKCGGIPPYQIFTDDGQQTWCSCRSPRIRLIATKKAFRESQIPKKYMWKFYEDFEVVSDKANMLVGFATTIRERAHNEPWKDGFYFWGSAGTGKTLLACIILQELMMKYSTGGRFVDLSRQFFQRLKTSFNTADESYGDAGKILDELIEMPFLVIDDFGVQRNTEWEMEMLYNLIDSRYVEERPTILTSNISVERFRTASEETGEKAARAKSIAHDRIASRIKEMCQVIFFELPDYRDKLKKTPVEL